MPIDEYIDDFPRTDDIILGDVEHLDFVGYEDDKDMYLSQLEKMEYAGVWRNITMPGDTDSIVLSFFYKSYPSQYPAKAIFVYLSRSSGRPVCAECYSFEYRKTVSGVYEDVEISREMLSDVPENLAMRSISELPLHSDYYRSVGQYPAFILSAAALSILALAIVFHPWKK